MKENILITGAGGFIGNRLSEMLEQSGKKVTKIEHILLNTPELLEQVVVETRPDVIYHLAAYGNQYFQKDWRETVQSNYLGTFNLLWASRDIELQGFVNTGSSSEYGKKSEPMKETDLPETNTIYGATKVGASYLARAFAEEFNAPVVNVRPFSVFGPGEAENRFIPTVIRCADNGEILKLSEGVHDWIYIDDFVSGMLMVSENAKSLKGETINIGSGVQYLNTEIVDYIESIIGKKVVIENVQQLRNFDTTLSWVADNSKLRSLGWAPQENIISGLQKTINAKRTS